MNTIETLQPTAPLLSPGGTAPSQATGAGSPVGVAKKAARDFESILLNKVMEEMQNTVPDSGLLDGAMTKQVQGMFWFYLSQDVASKGGAGMWKQLYQQMASQDHLPSLDSLQGGTLPSENLAPTLQAEVSHD